MDPMDLGQLLSELSSPSATASVSIRAESTYPGLVLGGPLHDRHIIVRAPLLTSSMATLTLRSIYGGHTLTVRRSRHRELTVHPQRLNPGHISGIPEIPRAFIPADPQVGDRVAYTSRNSTHLGVSSRWIYTHDGLEWKRNGQPLHPRLVANDGDGFTSSGWFVYLPASHRTAHLYVDGLPTPARTAAELHVGDVLREPGGGRHVVRSITREGRVSTLLGLEVLRLTDTPHVTQVPTARAVGDRLEVIATPHTLYPVEPRATEIVHGSDLKGGDVIISTYGAARSAVATVRDVWRQQAQKGVHVRVTTVDGRPVMHYANVRDTAVLLHRPAASQQAAA